jgi:hypothetical protein
LLISCDMSFIKDKQKEVNKNRKQVKSWNINEMNLFKKIC